jgi:hypothetical protein
MKATRSVSLAFGGCLWLAPAAVLAQMYDGSPCDSGGDPALGKKLEAGLIEKLDGIWFGHYDDWATSYLEAQGKPPKPPDAKCEKDDDCLETYYMARDRWTCKYSAHSAQDRDAATAWCEGSKGHGVGDAVIVARDTKRPLEIFSGYGKSKKLHRANGRPQSVQVYVLQADETGVTEMGEIHRRVRVLAKQTVELADRFGFQPLPLPAHEATNNEASTFVALEILSVYEGTRYDDTCISEIRNVQKAP